MVSGTGVNHKGMAICEQTATKALPRMTMPALRSQVAEIDVDEASGEASSLCMFASLTF